MAIGESELQRIGDYVRGNLHTWLLEAPPPVAVGRDLVETQVRLQQELKHLRETMENRFAAQQELMEARFAAVDQRFASIQETMKAGFAAVDKQFSTVKWMGLGGVRRVGHPDLGAGTHRRRLTAPGRWPRRPAPPRCTCCPSPGRKPYRPPAECRCGFRVVESAPAGGAGAAEAEVGGTTRCARTAGSGGAARRSLDTHDGAGGVHQSGRRRARCGRAAADLLGGARCAAGPRGGRQAVRASAALWSTR